MTHVVTDNCRACRFTECVATCPVDCFHIGDDMLYIDPVECIDCAACIPACPVQAIYSEYDMPDNQRHWLEVNAKESQNLPVIRDTLDPLPGALEKQKALGLE